MRELIRAYIRDLEVRARTCRKLSRAASAAPLTHEHLHGRAITYNVVAIELQAILDGFKGEDGTDG